MSQWAADADTLLYWALEVQVQVQVQVQAQAQAGIGTDASASAFASTSTSTAQALARGAAQFLLSSDCSAARALVHVSEGLLAVVSLPGKAHECADRLEGRVRALVHAHTGTDLDAV